MKKTSLIIAFTLVSFISTFAQGVDKKEIINRDIEWTDFVGDVDTTSKYDSMTNWITTYNYGRPTIKNDRARISIAVHIFLRGDSWVKPNKKSDRLLEHERGHFKIAKISAKEFQETVNATEFDVYNYAKQIDALYWQILEKYKEIEKQYDRETNHYNNQAQQAIWNKKLNDLLNN